MFLLTYKISVFLLWIFLSPSSLFLLAELVVIWAIVPRIHGDETTFLENHAH